MYPERIFNFSRGDKKFLNNTEVIQHTLKSAGASSSLRESSLDFLNISYDFPKWNSVDFFA